jgi:hypothetical protein
MQACQSTHLLQCQHSLCRVEFLDHPASRRQVQSPAHMPLGMWLQERRVLCMAQTQAVCSSNLWGSSTTCGTQNMLPTHASVLCLDQEASINSLASKPIQATSLRKAHGQHVHKQSLQGKPLHCAPQGVCSAANKWPPLSDHIPGYHSTVLSCIRNAVGFCYPCWICWQSMCMEATILTL